MVVVIDWLTVRVDSWLITQVASGLALVLLLLEHVLVDVHLGIANSSNSIHQLIFDLLVLVDELSEWNLFQNLRTSHLKDRGNQ